MEGEGGSVSRGMSKSHNFSLYKLKLCVKKRRKNHPGRLVLDGLGGGAWRRRPGPTPWVPLRFGPRTCFADALSVRSPTKRSDDRITQGSVQIVLIFRLLLKITVDWPFHANYECLQPARARNRLKYSHFSNYSLSASSELVVGSLFRTRFSAPVTLGPKLQRAPARGVLGRPCYAGVSSDRTNLSPFTKDYRGLALQCDY